MRPRSPRLFPRAADRRPCGVEQGCSGVQKRADTQVGPYTRFQKELSAMSSSPFCTCTNTACRCHPANHDQGCNLCIQKELRKGEIPACFFNLVIQPGETVEDCTIQAFARRVLETDKAQK